MNAQTINTHAIILTIISLGILLFSILYPFRTDAILVTSPPRTIQSGDITTTQILDNTILGIDISETASTTFQNLLITNLTATGTVELSTLSINTLTGTLTIASGGTGSTTPSGLLYGDNAGNFVSITTGTANEVLTSQAGSAPVFAAVSGPTLLFASSTEVSFTGTANHMIAGVNIPANTLGTRGYIQARIEFQGAIIAASTGVLSLDAQIGGYDFGGLCRIDNASGSNLTVSGYALITLHNNNATNAQLARCFMIAGDSRNAGNSTNIGIYSFDATGSATIDTTNDAYFEIDSHPSGAATSLKVQSVTITTYPLN